MPSVKSTICSAALEVIENKEATVGDKLKACTILLRLKALVHRFNSLMAVERSGLKACNVHATPGVTP
jgi:hypothetical protein